MIDATGLKNGTTFLFEGKPRVVLKYEHKKIGRGGAKIKVTSRDLESGAQGVNTFTPNQKFDEINTIKKKAQFLYKDKETAIFMDPTTYEQFEINLEVIGESASYLQEGEEVSVLFWEDKPLSVEMPVNVVLEVVETGPGVRGNSATNIFKPAKLSNGLSVKVPLFMKKGDKVRIDTKTGEYVERV